jgi:site-specific DNA recombinase
VNYFTPLPKMISAKRAECSASMYGRSYFTRLVRLGYLAPDITQAILDGRQPRDLTREKLLEHSRLPLAWHDQRIVLGFG